MHLGLEDGGEGGREGGRERGVVTSYRRDLTSGDSVLNSNDRMKRLPLCRN